jgi:hypothetical protein
MSRIGNTLMAIVAISILLWIQSEALRFGAPAIFSIVPILMIIILVYNVIRNWIKS